MNLKEIKKFERIFKGVANHRRLSILFLIEKNEGIILEEIAGKLKCNVKTISEHTRRLKIAGLILKKPQGKSVQHFLSPYGKQIIVAMRTFLHTSPYVKLPE